jgi:hypothetical protein
MKSMRGKLQAQPDFFTVINLNATMPADHPLHPELLLKRASRWQTGVSAGVCHKQAIGSY